MSYPKRQQPWNRRRYADRERLRQERLWRDAYESVKRPPNKYARLFRGFAVATSVLLLLFALVLAGLAIAFGPDQVVEALDAPEFLYGAVMRVMILFSALIFAGFLACGWIEDRD